MSAENNFGENSPATRPISAFFLSLVREHFVPTARNAAPAGHPLPDRRNILGRVESAVLRARALLGTASGNNSMSDAMKMNMNMRRHNGASHSRKCAPVCGILGDVEKTIWGSPAGKKRLAPRLVKMMPPHKVYVEPFAGSGAVFFEKAPAEKEVLNDADPEIARAFRTASRLTKDDMARLRRMNWRGDREVFERMRKASEPADAVEALHRFLYLTHFSYGKMRGRSFSPSGQDVDARTVERLEEFAPRLKNATIRSGDYEAVIREFDGKDTLFFLDPPYPGYDVGVGEGKFDEERFFGVLKGIQGKWLMTYGVRGKLPGMLKDAGYYMKRIRTPRTIRSMTQVGGPTVLTQLIVANYDFEKQAGLEKSCGPLLLKSRDGAEDDGEHFVLGVVLEPERVDAQGDIYSEEEVRRAAHRFMEEFGGLGLMHRMRVNDQVKVLESYLAPTEFTMDGVTVPKGTWLLGVRVLSGTLWERIRCGELTGFSIGGTARREPEAGGSAASGDAAEEQTGAAEEGTDVGNDGKKEDVDGSEV